MSLMNRGNRSSKRKIVSYVIIGMVIISFMASILAFQFY